MRRKNKLKIRRKDWKNIVTLVEWKNSLQRVKNRKQSLQLPVLRIVK